MDMFIHLIQMVDMSVLTVQDNHEILVIILFILFEYLYNIGKDGDFYMKRTVSSILSISMMFQLSLFPTFAKEEELPIEDVIVEETDADSVPSYWMKKDGRWVYYYEGGAYATDCWRNIDGYMYYFDGIYMHTGWLNKDGDWWYY